ncbi:MAG: hypothetical protein M3R59_02635 [Verrucomicrobiota bacterium]|nr:hypothetical protein [Verrucomicrobiota bacterium]
MHQRRRTLVRTARIEHFDAAAIREFDFLPAKDFEKNIARDGNRRAGEETLHYIRQRQPTRARDQKTRWALLQEKFLQRRQLMQHRFLNGVGQTMEQPFQTFDDVEKSRAIHCRQSPAISAPLQEMRFVDAPAAFIETAWR